MTIQTTVNLAAPDSVKDTAVRALKTFIAAAAGTPLTIALFDLDISSAKAIGISAGIAATNVVMNALLKWASKA